MICIILTLLASVLVILAVLVQNPKSGMAANFGASNQVMGVRETTNFLEKFTWTMAVAIAVLSLVATMTRPTSFLPKHRPTRNKSTSEYMAIDLIAKFSVIRPLDLEEAEPVFAPFLAADEKIQLAFANVRDQVVFTDKKIIALDVQGFTGTKRDYRFFPYSKITSFSVETAGTFDLDADFKIWLSGVGCFEIKFGKALDIIAIGKFLAGKIH